MPSLTKVQTGFVEAQGALPLSSGTAAAPGLKFSDHDGTGMFSPSTGAIGFSTSGHQQALTILANGNVGIGADNPSTTLHLSSATPIIKLQDSDSTGNAALQRIDAVHSGGITQWFVGQNSTSDTELWIQNVTSDDIRFGTNNTERVRITSGGALNIGKGDESINAANIVEMYVGGTDETYGTIRGKYNRTNEFNRSEVRFGVENNANGLGFLAFATGNNSATERLRITSGGTLESYSPDDTTPNIKWRSNDTNWYGSLNQSVENGTITSFISCGGDWSASGTTYSATKALAAYPTSAIAIHNQYSNSWGSQFVFLTKAGGSTTTDGAVTERLRITSDGDVGIGTDNPYAKNHIQINVNAGAGSGSAGVLWLKNANQTANNSATIFFGNNSSQAAGAINFIHKDYSTNAGDITFDTRANGSTYAERLRITSGGRIGINQTSPDAMLQVDYDEGNSEVGLRLRAYNASGSKTWQLSEINGNAGVFTIRNATNAQNILNINGVNQRVGINVDSPEDPLHVKNSSNAATSIRIQTGTSNTNNGDEYSSVIFDGNGYVGAKIASHRDDGTWNDRGDLRFYSGYGNNVFTERLRITNTGELSISGSRSGNNVSDAILKFNIVNSNGDGKKAEIKAIKTADISSELIFSTTSSHTFAERMRIADDGKVEIYSNGSYGNNAKALNIGSRTNASYQGSLAIARGEAIGGGTGPYMELVHGPDGGTQRTHQIYSYTGNLRVYCDANQHLELSGSSVKLKDANRVERFNQSGGVFSGVNTGDFFLSRAYYINSFSLSGYTVSAGTLFTVIPNATLAGGLYLIAITYTQNGGPYHHKAAATFYVSSKNSGSPNSNFTEGGIQHSHVGGSYLMEFQETSGSSHVTAGVRIKFNYSLSTTGTLYAYAYRLGI